MSDRCRRRRRRNGWRRARHGPRHGPSGPRPCLPPGIGQGRDHPMPRHRLGVEQGGAHPMAGVVQPFTGATSRPNPKHSSTGWGRCRYRPPPQMGSPWPTLRFMHKICREIQNEALRYPYRLTARPNPLIFCSDSPKFGQKWLKPINLPRAIQPAVARVARKAQRTSPR